MKYNSGSPYFFKVDIKYILNETKKLLLGNGSLRMGRHVKSFEKQFAKYINTNTAISTTSCTTALETIFNAIDLKENDEVIIPCQTYAASASTILRFNAIPIVCEIDADYNLDYNDAIKKINNRTKAVVIVHFGGKISSDIFLFKKYTKLNNIFLIEDAAHALGASYNGYKAGNIGDAAAFSFYSTKMITTGEGGMITTNNLEIAKKCIKFRSRGLKLDTKDEIYDTVGTNYRLTEFQGLLGLAQLRRIDKFIKHRNKIAKIYSKYLNPLLNDNLISIPSNHSNGTSSYWRYIIILNKHINREKIINSLKKQSIYAIKSYEPLIHDQPFFKSARKFQNTSVPFSEKYCQRHIMLPIHYLINEEDAIFIAKCLNQSIINQIK
jgi:perosamine synthetase